MSILFIFFIYYTATVASAAACRHVNKKNTKNEKKNKKKNKKEIKKKVKTTTTLKTEPVGEFDMTAMLVLRDANHDFYATGRSYVGYHFTNSFLQINYGSLLANPAKASLDLLYMVGPKMALNQSLLDACSHNLDITLNKTQNMLKNLNTGSVRSDVLATSASQSNRLDSVISANFSTELSSLLKEIAVVKTTHESYLRLVCLNSILHGFITNKSFEELDTFFKMNLLMSSNCSTNTFNDSRYVDEDKTFLEICNEYGTIFFSKFNQVQMVLQQTRRKVLTTQTALLLK